MPERSAAEARIHEALMELSRLAAVVAAPLAAQVAEAGRIVAACLAEGGKVLACGNGGSAADAQHFVAELVGRMSRERRALPALALSSDPSVVTALGNDYGFEHVFARQVEALGRPGDVLVAISTSGRSPNVVRAVETARRQGLRTIALLGEGGATALESSDVCLHVPSANAQRVQELHTAALHALCDYVERRVAATEAEPAQKG